MEYFAIRRKDFFYSAAMLNTEINFRTINELLDKKVIRSYRELADTKLLERILKNGFDISNSCVNKIQKLYDAYDKLQKIAEEYMKIASAEKIEVVSVEDPDYPYNWRVLSGMPSVFYMKGDRSLLDSMTLRGAVAVVGSRNPSKYSLYATEQISRELGEKGITIVSGMAYGIDRQAHLASFSTLGGTVAVLAGGVDNIYPPSNKDIYEMISNSGLIISEMPPGQKPLRQYFPSRNRLIAGLTDCTLVMEAGAVSGTLHTASFAANQGKEVFVLPNNIYYENAKGGLKLLEDGGNVLLGTDSVIDSVSRTLMFKRMGMGCDEELYFSDDRKDDFADKMSIEMIRELSKVRPEALEDDQWKLLIKDYLTLKPLCADELCVMLMQPFYKISKLLTELELNGTVCQEKGKYCLTFV